jgi:acetyl-CoA carboxylase carboxyl transferase subunit alpha
MNSNLQYLDFEEEIKSIDDQIKEIKRLSLQKGISYSCDIRDLHKKRVLSLQNTYNNLTPWQVVKIARHPQRPILEDYLNNIVHNFREMHGDRCYGDDRAIITGLGEILRHKVMIVGHNKGKKTSDNIERNFGCAHPEGYRKALLKMKFAEKYNIPIITFIDTPGAYPGIGAEERGQAQSIARNMFEMSKIKTPIINIVIGEGGSGGALGIGVGDQLAMLEYAYYSVISPEGCAAILWRDGSFAEEAAESLKLTSWDIKKLNLVDQVIKEPLGGSHRSHHDTFYSVGRYIYKTLNSLKRRDLDDLLEERYKRLRSIGQ